MSRKGLFSPKWSVIDDDIQWITCLRTFIHAEGISIPGLKKLLEYVPCWEVAGCPAAIHEQCSARVDRCAPRTLHRVGDVAARVQAKEVDIKNRSNPGQKKKHQSSG
jgi:MerR family transcriptional regulator/heat shock protein HspR